MTKQETQELYAKLVDARIVRDDAYRQLSMARLGKDPHYAANLKYLENAYRQAQSYFIQCEKDWLKAIQNESGKGES